MTMAIIPARQCVGEGCERVSVARHRCSKHYYRLLVVGGPGIPPPPKPRPPEYIKAWHQAHPGYKREASRSWRAKNVDRKKATDTAWRDANREKVRAQHRAWSHAHPDRCTDNLARQRARRRPVEVIGDVRRLEVWARDKGICQLCGEAADPKGWHLDHIVAIANGGTHTMDNVQVSHPTCNYRKGTK